MVNFELDAGQTAWLAEVRGFLSDNVTPASNAIMAAINAANRDLVQAELNLRYCDIVSEIDGVVTRRNVNPGNNVQAGQSLMAA